MSMADERPGRAIYSTGRGGAGNLIQSPSRGQDPEAAPGVERGRELSPHPVGEKITHSGRGGAGNIRPSSQSRTRADLNAEEREEALQEKLIADRRGRQAIEGAFSTGRGGVGNINRSKSRSRSAVRNREDGASLAPTVSNVHTTGRGGFGNITEERGDSVDLEKEAAQNRYEADVLARHKAAESNQPYMSGKGGAGNLHSHDPSLVPMEDLTLEEREAHDKLHARDRAQFRSGGRGGAGNMIPNKEQSPGPAGTDGDRGRGRHEGSADGHKGGMFGNVLRSLSRAAGRERSTDGRREAA
ncbi:hypothetical protein IAU59_005328 [Kwoniella sp. CBS 9459]